MQIIAQLPTQYVQSTPHNELNVMLSEMTQDSGSRTPCSKIEATCPGAGLNSRWPKVMEEKDYNLRFRTTVWQEPDNKQVVSCHSGLQQRRGRGRTEKPSVNKHSMPSPWPHFIKIVQRVQATGMQTQRVYIRCWKQAAIHRPGLGQSLNPEWYDDMLRSSWHSFSWIP